MLLIDKYPVVNDDVFFKLYPDSKSSITKGSNQTLDLSPSGFKIYKFCKGDRTIREIHSELISNYELPIDSLVAFFSEAQSKGYISILDASRKKELNLYGSTEYYTPQSVSITLTNSCNLRCSYCYGNFAPEGRSSFTLNEIEDTFKKLKEQGVLFVELSGGEPLIVTEIENIILKTFDYFLRTSILTNGALFTDSIIKLLEINKDRVYIQVSIDGCTEETNYKVRGTKNTWERTLSNIKKLIAHNIQFRIAYVITNENKHELLQTCKLMMEIGVKDMAISIADGIGRGADLRNPDNLSLSNRDSIYNKELDSLLIEADKKYKSILLNSKLKAKYSEMEVDAYNCGAGWKLIVLEPNGDICACQMLGSISKIGNINDSKMENIFQNPIANFFQTFRKSKTDNACIGCAYHNYCSSCITRIFLANKDRLSKGEDFCEIVKKNSMDTIFDFNSKINFNI